MQNLDLEALKTEVKHIFDSGANEIKKAMAN
jgi:hypothetical protein